MGPTLQKAYAIPSGHPSGLNSPVLSALCLKKTDNEMLVLLGVSACKTKRPHKPKLLFNHVREVLPDRDEEPDPIEVEPYMTREDQIIAPYQRQS